MSCGVGLRHGLDPTLLWLWCRLAPVALIRPLAWELPHAPGVALKMKKRKKKKKKKKEPGPAGTGTPDIYATLFTALDPALLWLWFRPAAVAPIRSLAWELQQHQV